MDARTVEPSGVDAPRRVLPAGAILSASIWHLATFAIAMVATLAIWHQSRSAEEAHARVQFDFAADAIVSEVTDRLDAQVQALWGIAGLMAVNPAAGRADWRAFTEAARLIERLPGTQAIGYARRIPAADKAAQVAAMRAQGFLDYRIWPEGAGPEAVVVTFLKPLTERSRSVLGYDSLTDPERRAALERARDWGIPVVSGRVTLILETEVEAQPGFLLYLPIYHPGMPVATIAERQAALAGYAFSVFRARDFLLSRAITQRLQEARAAIEVYDGAGLREDRLFYRTPDFPSAATLAEGPAYADTIAEIVGGRTWTFRVAAVSPAMMADPLIPRIILASGIVISLLAAAVVAALALNRAQAMESNARLREDVARRQSVEAQLRDSEAKFRRLFDSIPLPTFAIDRRRLTYFAVNDAAVEKYGYSQEEFAGMHIADLRPQEDVPAMLRYLERVRNDDSYSGEFRHRLRDGTLIDVEVTAHNIVLDGRQLTIVIAHDITERKRAEKALAESEQRLRQAQKLEAIGQLTGGIAHDFNNILTVITGTIEILADAVADDPKLAAVARLIDEAATRGADTTRDLLAFARRQPLSPRDTDVNELVAGAMKLFRSTLGGQIEIESRLAPDLPRAFVDPSQLTTALLNLALNARDAMSEGGRLLLETDLVSIDAGDEAMHPALEPGEFVVIAVSDNGAGIPAAIRDKVFEPFFTTKEVGRGTGLGLSMVYGFVKQSNGHVTIYSEEGYGTTVRLYLPCAGALAQAGGLAREEPEVEGGSETILVVEDDELVRRYVVEHLRGLGYQTLVAANAAEALAIAENGAAFDLLFTDIVMPGPMNGRRLVEELSRRRPGLKFLFTSGYSAEAAMRIGGFGHGEPVLNKPYRRAALAQKIREALAA